MTKRKCPACGSLKTISKSNKEETDSFRICKECDQKFGNNKTKKLNIILLDFFIGGYFQTNTYIRINGIDKTIMHANTHEELLNDHENKKLVLNDEQWNQFLSEISELELNCWKKDYVDPNILDGTQWSIKVDLINDEIINISGSNQYPPYWSKFKSIIKTYSDVKI